MKLTTLLIRVFLLVSAIFFLVLSETKEQHSQLKNQIFPGAVSMNDSPMTKEKHTNERIFASGVS